VSITVVREAVNYLKATGVLVGVPGVAVFVAERTIPNG
jgi:DNA-binding GntR family transcriptional regulator